MMGQIWANRGRVSQVVGGKGTDVQGGEDSSLLSSSLSSCGSEDSDDFMLQCSVGMKRVKQTDVI
jgi:hypothetical protein